MSSQEITTGTVLETHVITGMCPTKTPAEVRPVQIAEEPVFRQRTQRDSGLPEDLLLAGARRWD